VLVYEHRCEGVLECADTHVEHAHAGLGRPDRHPQRLGRPHHAQGARAL